MTTTPSSTDAGPKRPDTGVAFWYDCRLSLPPKYRVVAALVTETRMAVTAYRDASGAWRLVGRKADQACNVAWWSDCIPVPLPDPSLDRDRCLNEARAHL